MPNFVKVVFRVGASCATFETTAVSIASYIAGMGIGDDIVVGAFNAENEPSLVGER